MDREHAHSLIIFNMVLAVMVMGLVPILAWLSGKPLGLGVSIVMALGSIIVGRLAGEVAMAVTAPLERHLNARAYRKHLRKAADRAMSAPDRHADPLKFGSGRVRA